MSKKINMTGLRIGILTVVAEAQSADRHTRWLCRCDCGNETIATAGLLRHSKRPLQSCGCRRGVRSHGMGGRKRKPNPAYETWCHIKRRCLDEGSASFADYGGRGITVCERWRGSFVAFLEDMGERPAGMSIDRINNDGNYEPGNCRWADKHVQAQNRRDTVLSPEIVRAIRAAHASGMRYADVGRALGVNKEKVRKVCLRETWANVP
jgi:hypothetical protein